jgi:cobyrinic acid a,c-diamide synthase
MNLKNPSVVIAGLSGGSGKSLCAIGLIATLSKKDFKVAPFKKGPDFIDASWLSKAASGPCYNLDLFMMGERKIKESFFNKTRGCDIAVIEGNRGLFDGVDKKGSYSTANLARLLGTKVVLVIDCTKMTGTAAALVLGCKVLDPKVDIAGVILNKAGGKRHIRILTDSIEYNTGIPVLGAIPRLQGIQIFERHLGLLPPREHKNTHKVIEQARQTAEKYLDIKGIIKAAGTSIRSKKKARAPEVINFTSVSGKRVGVIMDRAFNFYYPENLEELETRGAAIIRVNALKDPRIPKLDLLYIGGGFPETSASALSKNISFKRSLKQAVEKGLHVYAECGGVVYLGNKLYYKGKVYKMTGILDLDFRFTEKPQGHGYTILKIIRKNPFFKSGTVLKGHEFHYTGPVNTKGARFSAEVKRGFGFDGKRDGLIYKNLFATYTHLHALGVKDWAKRLLCG